MASEWFVQRDGKTAGPFTSQQLRQLAASERLTPTDHIRQGTNGEFVPASKARGLFEGNAKKGRPIAPNPVSSSTPPISTSRASSVWPSMQLIKTSMTASLRALGKMDFFAALIRMKDFIRREWQPQGTDRTPDGLTSGQVSGNAHGFPTPNLRHTLQVLPRHAAAGFGLGLVYSLLADNYVTHGILGGLIGAALPPVAARSVRLAALAGSTAGFAGLVLAALIAISITSSGLWTVNGPENQAAAGVQHNGLTVSSKKDLVTLARKYKGRGYFDTGPNGEPIRNEGKAGSNDSWPHYVDSEGNEKGHGLTAVRVAGHDIDDAVFEYCLVDSGTLIAFVEETASGKPVVISVAKGENEFSRSRFFYMPNGDVVEIHDEYRKENNRKVPIGKATRAGRQQHSSQLGRRIDAHANTHGEHAMSMFNQIYSASIRELACGVNGEKLVIEFDVDTDLWHTGAMGYPMPMLIRLFNEDGKYVKHFYTTEVFAGTWGQFDAGRERYANQQKLPPGILAHRSADALVQPPHMLYPKGNQLVYAVGVDILRVVRKAEIGFVHPAGSKR